MIRGDLESLRSKITENRITEIVHIRGVNNLIEDLPFADDEEIETAMWNPFHFAVYHKRLPIVEYFVRDLKIDVSITAPKAHGESEKDPTNSVNFPEDKIILLLMANANRDGPLLKYLLDELWYFWSITFVDHLLGNVQDE